MPTYAHQMSTIDVSRPPALQARSKETQQRILAAALEILAESGVDALSTARVSEAAGVSVGSIYRRFGNKQQLLLAAQDEFLRLFLGAFTERLDEAGSASESSTPPEAFAHAVTSLMRTFESNAAAMQVLMILGLQSREIFEAGRVGSHEGARLYAKFMLAHRSAIRRPDPERAVDYTFRLVYAACSHRIIQGPNLESYRAMEWDELVSEMTETVCAYLLTPIWLPQS